MKKIVIGLLITLTVFLSGCSCSKKDDKLKNDEKKANEELHLNTNENIIKEVVVENVSFSNISLLIDKGISKFTCTIENKNEGAKVVGKVLFTFKDKNGETLLEQGFPIDVLGKGEKTTITFNADVNLSDATKLEYKLNA